MKIWVTRNSASNIQGGGLERLFVWFRKPVWIWEWRNPSEDSLPFGEDLSDLNGRRIAKWAVRQSGTCWIESPISFGKLFGYDDRKSEGENEIAQHVWEQLTQHFKEETFEKWPEVEKRGEARIQDFLLELEIDMKLKL